MSRETVADVADILNEDLIMYDGGFDPVQAGGVLARGVVWLGAAEGAGVQDRTDASHRADRVACPALFGDAHGPRLLELLDAAYG